MRVDDRIRKAVVFVGQADKGPFMPHGTGFLTTEILEHGHGWQTLVTAKHVIDGINSRWSMFASMIAEGRRGLSEPQKKCGSRIQIRALMSRYARPATRTGASGCRSRPTE